MRKRILSFSCATLLLICLTACAGKSVSLQEESNTTQNQSTNISTVQEQEVYYQQLDALLLSAAVCEVDPQSAAYSLTEQADGMRLTLTVNSVPVSFDLQKHAIEINSTADGSARSIAYTSRCYEAVQATQILGGYKEHLLALGTTVIASIEKDLDGDGSVEYLLATENFTEQWLNTATTESPVSALLEGMTVCLLADTDETGRVVCHGVVLPEYVSEINNARWDHGMVHLLHGEDSIYRLFAGECAISLKDYSGQENMLKQLCARYVTYIEDQGYTDVHIRLADVSSAPGQEVVCCYSDGTDYTAVVLTAYCGRLLPLYSCRGSNGALFVVMLEDTQFLLEYIQRLGSDYSQSYSYQLFRFDDTYSVHVNEESSIQIAADQGGGEEGTAFFEKVNQFLQNAQVCYDPYILTGYEVMMEQSEKETILPEEKYLRISNCSTNKTGTVKVSSASSWLNFRTGPSTDHDLVLIDPTNPESFVKQVLGAPMTVILPENTNDPENPIWVHIRISYYGQTLEGYSSQRYVNIEGIEHVMAGDTFTVTAETNDTAVEWTSSDPSVASIDPKTGTLTAIRKGLVLITVTSASGLEDSCLIMID